MTETIFSNEDIQQIENRGTSLDRVKKQLERFTVGVVHPRLLSPCTVGDGVVRVSGEDRTRLSTVFQQAAARGRVAKFVPASGAATRMFKFLLSFLHGDNRLNRETIARQAAHKDSDAEDLLRFWDHLQQFAFFGDLFRSWAAAGRNKTDLLAQDDIRGVLEYLLMPQGLGYADLPKGLIPFHRYQLPEGAVARTSFEEHLAEGAEYFCDQAGCCRQHFTVSPAYQEKIENHLHQACQPYHRLSAPVDFRLSFSVQNPSTDTIAVDTTNQPFRDGDGRLVFRPGGHGALLANLNRLDGDIVFIKNIDNIARKELRDAVRPDILALGGLLVELQQELFAYLGKDADGGMDNADVARALDIIRQRLNRNIPEEINTSTLERKKRFVVTELNRPLRVCGVVRHAGEPGGGPFQVKDQDGRTVVQIVEAAQVNLADNEQRAIWEASTHFNPVIIVCGLRDFQGNPFHLPDFADPAAGIITEKSLQGRPLKALEHPGLWNGGMAYWNTVFVELPPASFNPVKTVLDLLRKGHQSD